MRRCSIVTSFAGVMALSLVVGCTGEGAEPRVVRIHGVPVRAEDVRRAGSPIADGFTVAPGSVLFGREFPFRYEHESGWDALVLVAGDPARVIDAYRAQAEAQGLTYQSSGNCRSNGVVLGCDFSHWSDPSEEGRGLAIGFTRRKGGPAFPPTSALTLTYYNRYAFDAARERVPLASTPTVVESPVPLPTNWQALPRAGKRYGTPVVNDRGVRVTPVTALVGPVAVDTCGTGGEVAVLRGNGDPKRVVEGYARQFNRYPDVEMRRRRFEAGERRVIEASELDAPGAGTFVVRAVSQDGEPTYVWVERCFD